MTVGAARTLVFLYLATYAFVLMYPGVVPFNRIRPLVLGMPFVLVWVACWVVLGGLVLHLLERATTRAEEAEKAEPEQPATRPWR